MISSEDMVRIQVHEGSFDKRQEGAYGEKNWRNGRFLRQQ